MRSFSVGVITFFAIFLAGACNDDDDPATPTTPTLVAASGSEINLDGTWESCFLFGFQNIFSGTTLTMVVNGHDALDCSDTPTELLRSSGTFSLGEALDVGLSGTTVSGAKFDITDSAGQVDKDIIYVDDTGVPSVMYFGEDSSPVDAEGRPTELAILPFSKQ